MLISLIRENAEELFLSALTSYHQKGGSRGILLCRFSIASYAAQPDDVLAAVKDILADHEAEIFFCHNHDVLIVWRGKFTEITKAIKTAFQTHFEIALRDIDQETFFQFHDSHVGGEDLRLIFIRKLEELKVAQETERRAAQALALKNAPPEKPKPVAAFTPEQLISVNNGIKERHSKRGLEFFGMNILAVEDQPFSRQLLMSALSHKYNCFGAKDAKEAIALYAEHAPDITFLDIELPDIDGHSLAALFKKHDPSSYIVMVTANNQMKDVETARLNKVQGFIVKPYNKQKIMDAISAFINRNKR